MLSWVVVLKHWFHKTCRRVGWIRIHSPCLSYLELLRYHWLMDKHKGEAEHRMAATAHTLGTIIEYSHLQDAVSLEVMSDTSRTSFYLYSWQILNHVVPSTCPKCARTAIFTCVQHDHPEWQTRPVLVKCQSTVLTVWREFGITVQIFYGRIDRRLWQRT